MAKGYRFEPAMWKRKSKQAFPVLMESYGVRSISVAYEQAHPDNMNFGAVQYRCCLLFLHDVPRSSVTPWSEPVDCTGRRRAAAPAARTPVKKGYNQYAWEYFYLWQSDKQTLFVFNPT